VFSLKAPLFGAVQKEFSKDPIAALAALVQITNLIDKLGLFTMEAFQRTVKT